MMKRLLVCVAALGLASPALAGSYRIVLSQPEGGRLLTGHAGVQAADERNNDVLIRLISPGNEVKERGTVRVLVMNLGSKPFEFGPDQVQLKLADGSVLQPTPIEKFDKGLALIQREMGHARAVNLQNSSALTDLAQTSGGSDFKSSAPMTDGSTSAAAYGAGAGEFDRQTVDSDLPGASMLNALDQLLVPLDIGPRQAWGGYYVFDVPKGVFSRKADQPLTVIVNTGAQEHRFPAMLHWK